MSRFATTQSFMSPRTGTAWVTLTSEDDQILPQPGELIRLRYEMANLDFYHGPRSVIASSVATSCLPQGSPGPRASYRGRRGTAFHYVLVGAAFRELDGSVRIGFYPIVSYSCRPKGWVESWNALDWMENASDAVKLHHIPIPANDWNPEPHPAFGSNRLAFQNWKNNRPAWLAVHMHTHTIAKTEEWHRYSPTPLMLEDLGVLGYLSLYMKDIERHLASTSTTQVGHAMVPSYDNIWNGIITKKTARFYPDNPHYVDIDEEEIWSGEGKDFFSVWRNKSAPAAIQDEVKEYDDSCLTNKILEWDNSGEGYEPTEAENGSTLASESLDSSNEGMDCDSEVQGTDIERSNSGQDDKRSKSDAGGDPSVGQDGEVGIVGIIKGFIRRIFFGLPTAER